MQDRAVFQLRRADSVLKLEMSLAGARTPASIEPQGLLPGTVNYLRGKDPARWQTQLPTYQRLNYRSVYPGIDLTYYGNGSELEYDFVVCAGANSGAIAIDFAGDRGLRVTDDGELAIETDAGEVLSKKPVIYQEANGVRREVAGGYRLSGGRVMFQVAKYDRGLPLTIDPVLNFASYLGGSDYDLGADLEADASGMYATGTSYQPLTGKPGGSLDIYVVKMNPAGTTMIYSTYLGGGGSDIPNASAVAADGSLYVAGATSSTDFPTTPGAFSTSFGGGTDDAFVLKLSPAGDTLTYSTYVGGSGADDATGLFADAAGNVYVTGVTNSGNFPVTSHALQATYGGGDNDAFVFRMNANGTALTYSTYLGGSGSEGFENPVGGSLPGTIDTVFGTTVWVDSNGNAYVGGATDSNNFPVTQGSYSTTPAGGLADGYVAKLSPDGSTLVFSTFFGGSGFDAVTGLRSDLAGNVVAAGITASSDMPVSAGALYATYLGGYSDAFLAVFDAGGSTLVYSSYFGGSNQEAVAALDVSSTGAILLSGTTFSTNLPTTSGTYQTSSQGSADIFLAVVDAGRESMTDCSYFGTPGFDSGTARYGLNNDDILLNGWTNSSALAVTTGAVQATYGGGGSDMVVARLWLNLPVTQTINFPPLPNVAANATPFAVTATASSGWAVTFTSNTPAVCTVAGNVVTIVDTGGCSITATQPGDNMVYLAAAPVTQRFTVMFGDVAPSDIFYSEVNEFAQYGITAGCAAGQFCPTLNVTRDEMAVFIVRAIYGSDNFTYTTTPYFTDVQPSTFGFAWIQKLKDLGVTSGCTLTTYCPGEVVNRDQMAIFVIRARLGVSIAGPVPTFTYPTTPYFTDATVANEFAFQWIQRMKLENITSGCTVTTYCSLDPVTREEMATFIMRGAFNQFLPARTPVLTQISPATLARGTTATFTITGANTNFMAGTTVVNPLPGITIGTITVSGPTVMTVQLTAASNAVPQPYSVLAITGGEQDVLPNGLVIQ